jgi:hypothetical protein
MGNIKGVRYVFPRIQFTGSGLNPICHSFGKDAHLNQRSIMAEVAGTGKKKEIATIFFLLRVHHGGTESTEQETKYKYL